MENVIESIIAADKKAQVIVEKAQAKREVILQETVEQKAQAAASYRSSFARAGAHLNETEQAELDRIDAEAKADLAQRLAALEQAFAAGRSGWADEMTRRITTP